VLVGSGLNKSFDGRKVVKDVGLEVRQGEVVGLLGPNGAGKTTTFYMMVGLIKADAGSISLFDKDITELPLHYRALRGVGYLPQEPSVFRELTVQENIYSVLECRKIRRQKKKQMLVNLLTDLGLLKLKKSKGRELSGGERRRVEIARTLALEPDFILLDEPFAGVDPIAVQDLQKLIIGLKEKNIGILITDHNVRETLGIVDRAYIMNEGELLISGLPDDIINDDKAKKFYLGEQFKM
jgi:lipopolysaccharide export system ATP-binding protein